MKIFENTMEAVMKKSLVSFGALALVGMAGAAGFAVSGSPSS